MTTLIQLKTTNPSARNAISFSPLRRAFLLIPLALACFALSQRAQALTEGSLGSGNTVEGGDALFDLTTGAWNTALGNQALFSDTTGNCNTATGFKALFGNTGGAWNTATGVKALQGNTTGDFNTADGGQALLSNTTGVSNTAVGSQALQNNTTGNANTAVGRRALMFSTTQFGIAGSSNTATGFAALQNNSTGNFNTANGVAALFNNQDGNNNTATGYEALENNFGHSNTANGVNALQNNTIGNDNTAEGNFALVNTTGSNNIGLGSNAGSNLTTGDNNIAIGAPGVAAESAKIRIGTVGTHNATFIAGISVSAITGTAVVVNANGRLGVASSSQRFKDQIKPMDKASEAVLALRPVTFRYKQEIDPEGTSQFGLIAEEVEKVNPALVTRDAQGKVFTVRYDAVNAMLLNEFLKEHRKVEEQEATIAELKSAVAKQRTDFQTTTAQQQKEIRVLIASQKEQASQIQKVNTQVEIRKPAPQTAFNNP